MGHPQSSSCRATPQVLSFSLSMVFFWASISAWSAAFRPAPSINECFIGIQLQRLLAQASAGASRGLRPTVAAEILKDCCSVARPLYG